MNWVSYFIFRVLVIIFSLIPFRLMYLFSDFVAWFLRVVIKYRVKVVKSNLERCFPEKSEEEIQAYIRAFYINLSDITLESIKGNSMSANELLKRYKYNNPELLRAYAEKNIDLLLISSHYTNWEWMSLVWAAQMKAKSYAVYKPLSNKPLDNFLKRIREKMGMDMIDMNDAGKTIKDIRAKGGPSIFIFISDQSPAAVHKAHWVDFFNTKTAFIHGLSQFARIFNLPVFFYDVQRVKRGYYEVNFSLLTEEPKNLRNEEITALYAQKLEAVIKNYPPNWLWSHKRWKHKFQSEK